VRPPSESDDESSDGGEYIPDDFEVEDEDEDGMVDVDGFTEADADEFYVEPMDLDFDELWESGDHQSVAQNQNVGLNLVYNDAEMDDEPEYEETEADDVDGNSEWGLTDGESESMTSMSEGDLTMEEDEEASVAGGMWRPRGSVRQLVQLMVVALLLFSAGAGS